MSDAKSFKVVKGTLKDVVKHTAQPVGSLEADFKVSLN